MAAAALLPNPLAKSGMQTVPRDSSAPGAHIRVLAAEPDVESAPALSPDGESVAYLWWRETPGPGPSSGPKRPRSSATWWSWIRGTS